MSRATEVRAMANVIDRRYQALSFDHRTCFAFAGHGCLGEHLAVGGRVVGANGDQVGISVPQAIHLVQPGEEFVGRRGMGHAGVVVGPFGCEELGPPAFSMIASKALEQR